MKKNKKRGFIMAETIAISAVVVIALVLIYTQFSSVYNSYYKSFRYNSVNNLYVARNIKNYINVGTIDDLKDIMNSDSSIYYINLTPCSAEYFVDYSYCKALLEASEVKTLIFTKENVDSLKNYLSQNLIFNEGLNNFIKNINHSGEGYRIIVEFKDNTFATLLIGEV